MTADDLLNGQVLPFFGDDSLPVLRVLPTKALGTLFLRTNIHMSYFCSKMTLNKSGLKPGDLSRTDSANSFIRPSWPSFKNSLLQEDFCRPGGVTERP